MTRLRFASAVCLLAALPAAAQSSIRNARLHQQSAGELSRTFHELAREAGPLWVAYSVPTHSGWNSCCWGNRTGAAGDCGRCSLEERKTDSSIVTTDDVKRTIPLEGGTMALVLFRIEQGRLGRVRTYSEACDLDAGGRDVYWLADVKPADSVALLRSLVRSAGGASGDEPGSRRLIADEFVAIAAHQAPQAVAALIDLARNDPRPNARSDALFWLAQRAGQKAAGTITDAIANDPDTKVKEHAVFALSQLPSDDGVPKLIEVARTNRNPRVRQQAVFWLGQSKDPRALAFFEEILLK